MALSAKTDLRPDPLPAFWLLPAPLLLCTLAVYAIAMLLVAALVVVAAPIIFLWALLESWRVGRQS